MRRILNFSVSALVILSACATPERGGARIPASLGNEEKWPERVIDAHVHMNYTNKFSKAVGFEISAKEFQRQLAEVNGKAAIGHTFPAKGKLYDYRSLGIMPCIGISATPNYAQIKRALKHGYGCIKIYLGYQYQYANDEAYKQVYRIAEKFKVPVVFHTGDTLDTNGHLKYADPLTIDEVAVEFRKVKFVIAHVGNPWIQSAAEVAYKNANVYVDVSALLIGNLKKDYTEEELDEYVVKPIKWAWGYIEDPRKMMFATDWPLVRIKDYVEVTKRAIPQEWWSRFFYENAAEVFKVFGEPRPNSTDRPIPKSPRKAAKDDVDPSEDFEGITDGLPEIGD